MTITIPTPGELADLLAQMLTGAAGGDEAAWRKAIGPVEKLPTHTNIHSNWRIDPKGSAAELAAIDQAVEIARAAHPYVAK